MPTNIILKKIRMANGYFAECPDCGEVMSENIWGTGQAWACFKCDTLIRPRTWEWDKDKKEERKDETKSEG